MTRDQFILLITSGFYQLIFDVPDVLTKIISNDKSGMNGYLVNFVRAKNKIAANLAIWDGLPDQAARDAFAPNVVYDLGSDSVDPETAIFWPDTNGRFGNIKGPASSTSGNMVGFNSATGQLGKDLGAPYVVSRSQSSSTRSLNSAFQVSTTKDSLVNYSVDIACTLSLTTGQTGTVFLEIATNSAFTTGVQELCRVVNGNTGTLTIGLNLTQNVTGGLNGYVPLGYWVRIRTANTVGTPTFTYRSGQEVLL